MRVIGTVTTTGSQLAKTQMGWMNEFDIDLVLESAEDPAKVAEMVRLGENTCFTTQAVRNPAEVKLNVTLNNSALAVPE